MYGSVDNSRNDCINEKNLIIKNNTSYIAARDQIPSAQITPARATCQHNFKLYVAELMQVNSKGGREGGQILTVFDQSD